MCQKELEGDPNKLRRKNKGLRRNVTALVSSVVANMECDHQIICLFKRAAEEIPEPESKKSHESKSEFHLNSQKIIPTKYEQMDLTNLLNISSVEPKYHKMITQNTFEFKAFQKGSNIEMVQQKVVAHDEDREGPCYYLVGSEISGSQNKASIVLCIIFMVVILSAVLPTQDDHLFGVLGLHEQVWGHLHSTHPGQA